MKQENFRMKRKHDALNTAIASNFINIVLILIFKTIVNAISSSGNYNVFFGVVQIVLIAVFWLGFNYMAFRETSEENSREYSFYLIMCMIPMAFFTIITIIIMVSGGSGPFSGIWNALTFAVAPTVFLYLPYGLIYHVSGGAIPMAAFFIICFVLIIALQVIGYALGAKSRKDSEAEIRKRRAREEKYMAQQKQMAMEANKKLEASNTEASRMVRQAARKRSLGEEKPDPRDPLSDVESPAVIQTEAFTPITDQMIQEAMKKEKEEAAHNAKLSQKHFNLRQKNRKEGSGQNQDSMNPEKKDSKR